MHSSQNLRITVITILCLLFSINCGGAPGNTGSNPDVKKCLDENRKEVNECSITSTSSACNLSPNPSCMKLTQEVISKNSETESCLQVVIENQCEQVVYSRTCIEHVEEKEGTKTNEWQCWWSTTRPNSKIDVSKCNATGKYTRWWGYSSGELRTIDDRCNPRK